MYNVIYISRCNANQTSLRYAGFLSHCKRSMHVSKEISQVSWLNIVWVIAMWWEELPVRGSLAVFHRSLHALHSVYSYSLSRPCSSSRSNQDYSDLVTLQWFVTSEMKTISQPKSMAWSYEHFGWYCNLPYTDRDVGVICILNVSYLSWWLVFIQLMALSSGSALIIRRSVAFESQVYLGECPIYPLTKVTSIFWLLGETG